jgi:DNA-binding transcriptional LysR family regulator
MSVDWDHIRHFLAVIEHGSTRRAAEALGVEQTTCARRIKALEASLGVTLFDRSAGRFRPTAEAATLVPAAQQMRLSGESFTSEAKGLGRKKSHQIRITAEEATASSIVYPAVAVFSRLRPDIAVQIDVSTDRRDLHSGEADVAVRGGLEPTDPKLIRRKLIDDPFGIYCSTDYPDPPASVADLRSHWLASLEVLRPRLEAAGLGERVRHVTNSGSALASMIASGSVIGPLPQSVGALHPRLRCCFVYPAPVALWMIYPERMRGFPGLKQLSNAIAGEAKRLGRELAAAET